MQGSTEASTSAAPVANAPVTLAPQLQQRLAGTKGSRAAGSKKRKLACEVSTAACSRLFILLTPLALRSHAVNGE